MSWNYRVTLNRADGWEDGSVYTIREVHYDDGEVIGWTSGAGEPYGTTPGELSTDLHMMASAFERPILDITDETNPIEVDE